MTDRADIIRMAREAGFEVHDRKQQARVGIDALLGIDSTDKLERFADAAIADFLQRTGQYLTNDASREAVIADAVAEERDACAKICDEMQEHWSAIKDTALLNGDVNLSNAASGEPRAAESLAALIRARGAA